MNDCRVEAKPPSPELVADKEYDSQVLREWPVERGTEPVISPRKNRKVQYNYDRAIYRQRNVAESMFCRFKDWRRIATHLTATSKTSWPPSVLLPLSFGGCNESALALYRVVHYGLLQNNAMFQYQTSNGWLMNILYLSDNFVNGGLETHIIELSNILAKAGHKTFLAHGSEYNDRFYRDFSAVLSNLSLRYDSMVGQILDTAELLDSFIEENAIDVIHAHPFSSIVVGALIADRKKLPLVCTLHGPSSVAGAPGPNPATLWPDIVSHCHVIAVSHELGEIFNKRFGKWPDVQPNTAKILEACRSSNSKRMVWAGRLDSDKMRGLYKLLDLVSSLPEWELDIAGIGPELTTLVKTISDSPTLQGRVRLLGWLDDLQRFIPRYDIVAGMGRVIVEASGLATPSLLVGYDEVKGFMSSSSVDEAAFANFSGRSTTTSNPDDIRTALSTEEFRTYGVEMSHWIDANRSPDIIGDRYISSIANAKPFRSDLVRQFFDTISSSTDLRASCWYDERYLPKSDGASD